ncbi:Hypothetical protein Minf_0361 [Methylacidiphilum infernorum V4]|uniref:Uncharacterized protein n=1 Tax=Methylacidiphilum infernorum (isolate V4) TaxID=481448 RepID=B3DYP7_METI4|nr:Hypothetical protein Minf_0361 [Methylacidiphilum infernorum V4]
MSFSPIHDHLLSELAFKVDRDYVFKNFMKKSQ